MRTRIHTRFDCPSAHLALKGLLKRTRRALGIALAAAITVHLVFTQVVGGLQAQQKTAKPLTTQFVKREPRLTKPLEMKKRPQPKRRRIQRKMVAIQAKVDRRQTSLSMQPTQMIRSLSRPQVDLSRTASFMAQGLEPQTMAEIIKGERESEQVVDMSLEMMDIEALDTGQYHAMIIQDPADKRSVRGYFHLAVVYCRSYLGVYVYDRTRYLANLSVCMNRVSQYMNRYTLIQTDLSDHIYLETSNLYKVPWAFLSTYNSFQASEPEIVNAGKYLMMGGFIFADFVDHAYARGDASLRDLFKKALASQGHEYERAWLFETLPSTHHIYHCFFDFDGPPEGRGHYLDVSAGAAYRRDERRVDGVTLYGRLLGLVSTKSYANAWGDWGAGGAVPSLYGTLDPTRCLQFGVNSIVFALTQEGSITSQVMDSVNY